MRTIVFVVAAAFAGAAIAKLPPVSDEVKAQAAEATARAAWSDKVAAYKLCLSTDRVAAAYRAGLAADGKPAPSPTATGPCTSPGEYVSQAAAKPLEAAGAHSPTATAVSPPNSKATASQPQMMKITGSSRKVSHEKSVRSALTNVRTWTTDSCAPNMPPSTATVAKR